MKILTFSVAIFIIVFTASLSAYIIGDRAKSKVKAFISSNYVDSVVIKSTGGVTRL